MDRVLAHDLPIGEAATYLRIGRADLLALQRQDLIPWKAGAALPRFETAELDTFRPRLQLALRQAHALERRAASPATRR
jgi:hypothetical protein